MKLNEIKNEQAIETLADMFDPIMEIASDDKIVSAARGNDKISMVKHILKDHSRAVFELMALSEGVPTEEYECDIMALPMKLLELFNRPEFAILFQSQGQKTEGTSFGSATENTKDGEK